MLDIGRYGDGRKDLQGDPLRGQELVVTDEDAADGCGWLPAGLDVHGVPQTLVEDVAGYVDASGGAEVAHHGRRPLVQGEFVVGQDHVVLQRHLIGRLVEPRDQAVAGIGFDGRVGNVDPSAGVGHVDAVAVVAGDGRPCDVDITGAVHHPDSGHAVLADGRSLDVQEAADVLHQEATDAVVAHQRVRHVQVVRFGVAGSQFHLDHRPAGSRCRVDDPDRVAGRRDALRTRVVAQPELGDLRRAPVRSVVNPHFRIRIRIRHHMDEM